MDMEMDTAYAEQAEASESSGSESDDGTPRSPPFYPFVGTARKSGSVAAVRTIPPCVRQSFMEEKEAQVKKTLLKIPGLSPPPVLLLSVSATRMQERAIALEAKADFDSNKRVTRSVAAERANRRPFALMGATWSWRPDFS